MATYMEKGIPKYQIIIHGNNGFESSQLLNQLQVSEETSYIGGEFEFFPFTDLDEEHRCKQIHPSTKMKKLIEDAEQDVEVSAVLVLINHSEIFNRGMYNLIVNLPGDSFYRFTENNDKVWWESVIVVFSMEIEDEEKQKIASKQRAGGYNKSSCMLNSNCSAHGDMNKLLDGKVKESISRNGGIKEILIRAGGRYICFTENTKLQEFLAKLHNKMSLLKGKLVVGQPPPSLRFQPIFESFQKAIKKHVRAEEVKAKEFYQSFIILGESKSGKSSLGNLLLGHRDSQLFATEWYYKPSGIAKKFPIGVAEVDAKFACRNNSGENEKLKMQVVDQPEILKPKEYGEFLASCFAEVKKSMFRTFLIVFKLTTGVLPPDEIIKIKETIQILNTCDFDIFHNAIIVFTHHDRFDSSKFTPENLLKRKLGCETSVFTNRLMRLVAHRHTKINGVNLSEHNRNGVLCELFGNTSSESSALESASQIQRGEGGPARSSSESKLDSAPQPEHPEAVSRSVPQLSASDV